MSDESRAKQIITNIFLVCAGLTGMVLMAILSDFLVRIGIIIILYLALPVTIIGGIIWVIYFLFFRR